MTIGKIEKMSKSKNNGVDPQDMIDKYGADTVRLFVMFASPPEQSLEWSDAGVEGAYRFLKRYWKFALDNCFAEARAEAAAFTEEQRHVRRKIHRTIIKVNDDIGRRYTFNTAIAAAMELMNALTRMDDQSENSKAIRREGLEVITLLLSPIVPHITDKIWRALKKKASVIDAGWPKVDETALIQDEMRLIVQVNGKKRGEISVPVDADEDTIKSDALKNENTQRHTAGKEIIKMIVVPQRLVNVVVK